MPDSHENIKELLQAQLDIYRNVELLLEKIIDHCQGSVWGFEQVDKINNYFCQLKELDEKISNLKNSQTEFNEEAELMSLMADLKYLMLNVKNLMGVFQARISGGQQHVSDQLKSIVKSMEIKAYQDRGYFKSKNVACVL